MNRHDTARARLILAGVAATLVLPNAVVSHQAAAALWDLPMLSVPRLPCVTVAPRRTGDLSETHLHRATLWPDDVTHSGQIELTRPPRTVVDSAREHGAAAGVVIADAALRRQIATHEELDDVIERCSTWRGIRRARRAVAMADGRAESALESVSRWSFVVGGIPAAELQTTIFDESGQFVGRVDFYWDEFGVVGEADGRLKYDDPDGRALYQEKLREDRLRDLGLIVVRWGWAEARDPRLLARKLEEAFSRAHRLRAQRRWQAQPFVPL